MAGRLARAVISATRLRVACDAHGRTVVTDLHGEAPQLVRVTDPGGADRPLVAHLCGGAAGPVAGDRSRLDVEILPAARLSVRSVAANLVHPGPWPGQSHATLHVRIGTGAALDWWPEPLVAVAGCDHRIDTRLNLDEDSTLRWVDEIVCGRHGEPGGRIEVTQRVCISGRVVSHQTVTVPEPRTRVVVSAIAVGPAATTPGPSPIVDGEIRATRLHPTPGVVLWIGLGPELAPVHRALDALDLTR